MGGIPDDVLPDVYSIVQRRRRRYRNCRSSVVLGGVDRDSSSKKMQSEEGEGGEKIEKKNSKTAAFSREGESAREARLYRYILIREATCDTASKKEVEKQGERAEAGNATEVHQVNQKKKN